MNSEIVTKQRIKAERGDAFSGRLVSLGSARHVCVVLGVVLLAAAIFTTASYAAGASWITWVDDTVRGLMFGKVSAGAVRALALFANVGDTLVSAIIALITLLVLIWARKKRLTIIYLVSFITGEMVNFIVKAAVARPRPTDALIVPPASMSFPSGHTFTAILLIGTIVVLAFACSDIKPLRWVLMIFLVVYIAATALSRIVLGVHWPTDVLGGFCFGAAWLFFTAAAILKPGPWYGKPQA